MDIVIVFDGKNILRHWYTEIKCGKSSNMKLNNWICPIKQRFSILFGTGAYI